MAAGPGPTLFLAAFALLVVMASCNNRGFLRMPPKGSPAPGASPAPPVYSFGWAFINVHRVESNRSCEFVCSR
jgi:hypothetical protein